MIRIVNGPQDLKGFDQDQFYRVYEMREDGSELAALASTASEARDTHAMLVDLTNKQYTIYPPKAQAN
jgi:hypothetical protein